MYFTEGKLRPYEQLMRQSPQRSSSSEKQKKPTQTVSKPHSSLKKKEKADGNH